MRSSGLALGAVAIALAAFSAAQAQTTAYEPGEGSPNNIVLSIPVTASVGGQCGFSTAPTGSYHDPDLTDGFGNQDFPFTLQCTVASRVAVVSSNGGLKTSIGAVPSGYTDLVPYNVELNLVGDSGVTPQTALCAVANLVAAGSCTFRGPANTATGLRLDGPSNNQVGSFVRVSAPGMGSSIFVASNGYADTLTVTLSPSP